MLPKLCVLSLLISGFISGCVRTHLQPDTFDALQENVWYLPTEDPKTKLYVTELGEGPPVVVLHGGPGNDFNYLVPALRPLSDQYRFIFFDQRGSLLSPVAHDKIKDLSMDVLVQDLERLRVSLGQERLAIFGHSFGTLLALKYAEAHPTRVATLVLAASMPPRTSADKPFMQWIREAHGNIKKLKSRPEVERQLQAAQAQGDRASLPPQASARAFKINLAAFNVFHVERWKQLIGGGVYYSEAVDTAIGNSLSNSYDGLSGLMSANVPVTVIQGDQDYLDPAAKAWTPLPPGTVTVHVLTDAGHYSWVDAPEAFQASVRSGLQLAFPERP